MPEPTKSSPILHCSLRDSSGSPVFGDSPITLTRELKRSRGGRRSSLLVQSCGHALVLKTWRPGSIRQWLNSQRGISPVDREAVMLIAAAECGLPVPELLGRGWMGRSRLRGGRAFAVRWIEHHRLLWDLLDPSRNEPDAMLLDRVRDCAVKVMAHIRKAGFTDRDFGIHNILVGQTRESFDFDHPVWIDLETADRSEPGDPQGTALLLAGAMTCWWTLGPATRERAEDYFLRMCAALPRPDGGWSGVLDQFNERLTQRVARQAEKGRPHPTPPEFTFRESDA